MGDAGHHQPHLGLPQGRHDWKSPGDIIFKLVDIVSKGGNYLLNVGPMADGVIPQASQDVLRAAGRWLKVNGEAIYGATPTPFGEELGEPSAKGTKDLRGEPLFLVARTISRDRRSRASCTSRSSSSARAVRDSRDENAVKRAYLLANGAPLDLVEKDGRHVVHASETDPRPDGHGHRRRDRWGQGRAVARAGSGSVTAASTAGGVTLSCSGPGCQTTGVFATTDAVRLTAAPAAGATWVGWTAPGCADAEVRLTGATTCVAVFAVAASGGGGGSPGGDTPPAASGTPPTGPVEYVHHDALGTVRAVTGESGEVVRRHEYLPFGEEWPTSSGAPSRRFTGKEDDTPTGL